MYKQFESFNFVKCTFVSLESLNSSNVPEVPVLASSCVRIGVIPDLLVRAILKVLAYPSLVVVKFMRVFRKHHDRRVCGRSKERSVNSSSPSMHSRCRWRRIVNFPENKAICTYSWYLCNSSVCTYKCRCSGCFRHCSFKVQFTTIVSAFLHILLCDVSFHVNKQTLCVQNGCSWIT